MLESQQSKDRAGEAAARFFLGVAQAGASAKQYDEHTLPLFPLVLIMDCEGLLARDARHLCEGRGASISLAVRHRSGL
jgi:hypothetical protein